MLTDFDRQSLLEQGYVIFPGLLSAEQVAAFNERVEELFAFEGESAGGEFKTEPGARRIANAVDKGRIFEEVIETPEVLEAVGVVLGPDFKLSSLNIRSANPHNGCAQPLHVDSGALPDALEIPSAIRYGFLTSLRRKTVRYGLCRARTNGGEHPRLVPAWMARSW